jgi:hypothetical protein
MLAGTVGAAFLSVCHAQAETIWDKAFAYKPAGAGFDSIVTSYAPKKEAAAAWDSALAAYARAVPAYAPAPAVDGLNGKVDGWGGTLAKKSFYGTKGAVAMPLAGAYGLQIDGAVGAFDRRRFAAAGAHLFWRNPAVGMYGLYVAYGDTKSAIGDVHIGNVAAEFGWYHGRWSVTGIVGVEFGNRVVGTVATPFGNAIQTIDIKTRFLDKINVSYYLHDNIRTFIGHRHIGGKHAAALGLELAHPIPRTAMLGSLFVEGRAGEYTGIWGGLKLYIGKQDKSLIRRHREDDPDEWTPESQTAGAGNSTSSTPAPSGGTPPTPPPDDGAP